MMLFSNGLAIVNGYMGAMMGKLSDCDDASGPGIDWPDGDFKQFTCMEKESWPMAEHQYSKYYQIPNFNATTDVVNHRCMDERIDYNDVPPLRGDHRPNWAIFGEYLYLPEQRWLHNLEHGSIILLYHPCANGELIEKMRNLVTSCLYRHIITPYNKLKKDHPVALVAWGAKLELNTYDENSALNFITNHAKIAPENLTKLGKYDTYLLKRSTPPVGSNIIDDNLCPNR